jgi:alkanesulfonate monooxygenase SsuD/methylene tetrahydromethanopterin reductase-like flavin-dependent oxidoreductase (luciferase family)
MEFGSSMELHRRPGGTQAQAFVDSFAHVVQVELSGLDAIWLGESHFAPDRSVLSSPNVIATP